MKRNSCAAHPHQPEKCVANEVHGCGKARPVSTLSVSELNYLYQQHCEQVQAHMKAGHDFCCSEFDDEFESLTVKEQQLLYEHAFKQQLEQQKSSNTPTSTHPPPSSSSASSSKSSKLASSADLYDYVFHHDPANCPDCCQQFNDQTRAGSKAASTSSSSSTTSGPTCSANDLIDENDSLPKCAKEFNECKHFLKKNISKRLHLQQIPGYINSLKRESLVHSRLEQKLKEKYNNSSNNNSSSSQQANSASKVQSSSSAMNGNNIPLPKTLGSCEQGCCCAGVSRMRTPIANIKPIPTVVDVKVSMGTGAGNNNQKNVKKTSRTNSNDSSESTASSNIRYRPDNMDPNNVCTLMNDCKCKACLKRQKLTEELIAEEESNKKKKQKKKKKKAGKQKNQSDSEVIKEEGEEESVLAASDSVDNVKSKQDTEEGDTDFDQAKTQIVINNSKLGCFIEDKVSETPSKSSGKSSSKSSKSTNNNSGSNGGEQNGSNAAQDEWIQVKNTKSFKFGDESTPGTPGTNKRDRTSSSSESKERLQESDTLMASLDDTLVGPICSNSKVPVNGFTVSELNLNSYRAKLYAMDAQLAYLQGNPKDALQLISISIQFDGKNCTYYIIRSFYHECLCQYEQALADACTAIKLDKHEESFHYTSYRKIRALCGLKKFVECEKYLHEVIKQDFDLDSGAHQAVLSKELLVVRLKALIDAGYSLSLARLYAQRFNTIREALKALETNCKKLSGTKGDVQQHHRDLILKQTSSKTAPKNLTSDAKKNQTQRSSRTFADLHSVDGSGDEDDDDEIYFSDDDEYDMFYEEPSKWACPKSIVNHHAPTTHPVLLETNESSNPKGQRALWIGNVSPTCSISLVTSLFMKFGNVTFCKIFYSANETMNDVGYLLLHYDNGISPRLVMAYYKDKIVPGISKDNLPLVIRYRNKNDKLSEEESSSVISSSSLSSGNNGNISSNHNTSSSCGNNVVMSTPNSSTINLTTSSSPSQLTTSSSPSANTPVTPTAANAPRSTTPNSPNVHALQQQHLHHQQQQNKQQMQLNGQSIGSECYYWRTTGCDRERCSFRHLTTSKGVDKQGWMRKKN